MAINIPKNLMKKAPNYLKPEIPSGLKRVKIPIVEATAESLAGYGHIVSGTDEVEIEIVRWPAQGHRGRRARALQQ